MKRNTPKRKTPKNTVKPAIRCARDLGSVPFQVFHLPSDGERKWQAVCMRRRAVFQQLALAANQNGKSICLSADRIAADTGLGRATIFRILQDLRTLGFLTDEGKTHPAYHTRVRSLEVACALAAAKNAPSQINKGENSRKQPSQIKKQPSQINREQSQINVQPSHQHPDPTEEHTEELIEEHYRENLHMDASQKTLSIACLSESFFEEGVPEPPLPFYMRDDFFEEQEQTLPDREPLPREEFEEFRGLLIEAHLYDYRESQRDNGVLQMLWNLCSGNRDDRRAQLRDALEFGIDRALDGTMPTVAFWAQRRIENPETWQW